MNNYKNLGTWQKSIDLVVSIYNLTTKFPSKENFNLIQQINKAVVSVPSNIAEGAGRNSKKEFHNFLGIAMGSICELETQLILSLKIGYITQEELNLSLIKIEEIQKMITGLQKNLRQQFEAKTKDSSLITNN